MFTVIVKAENVNELQSKVKDLHEKFSKGEVVESANKVNELNEALKEDHTDSVTEPTPHLQTVGRAERDELDSLGMPWDARIHAGSKKQNKDGSWKKRKGVDDATFEAVKAELLGNTVQPVQVSQPTPAVQEPVAQPVQEPVAQPTPAMPQINTNGGHTLETFIANFAQVIGALVTEGKITQDYINQLNAFFNVTEIWSISEEQKAQVFQVLVDSKIITKVG